MRRHHAMRATASVPYLVYNVPASTNNLNLFTALSSPGGIVTAVLILPSGITIGDSGLLGWSLRTGAFAAGSLVVLVINGQVYGYGGDAQSNGGNAILLDVNASIDNTNGTIGGGGGGGQPGMDGSQSPYTAGGGGAGGGQGSPGGAHSAGGTGNVGNGTPGTDGSISAPGDGGDGYQGGSLYGGEGGAGGAFGQPGHSATNNSEGLRSGTYGAAGKAVNLNGKTVVWLGGNNPTQCLGAVA